MVQALVGLPSFPTPQVDSSVGGRRSGNRAASRRRVHTPVETSVCVADGGSPADHQLWAQKAKHHNSSRYTDKDWL